MFHISVEEVLEGEFQLRVFIIFMKKPNINIRKRVRRLKSERIDTICYTLFSITRG